MLLLNRTARYGSEAWLCACSALSDHRPCHWWLKVQELKNRMRGALLGKQEDYVTEVKGPGQVRCQGQGHTSMHPCNS